MSTVQRRYTGVWPVVPTTFTESGALDLESQKRCVDFMIDAGSNGLAILANFSEQFVLSDAERDAVADAVLEQAGELFRTLADVREYIPLVDELEMTQRDGSRQRIPAE